MSIIIGYSHNGYVTSLFLGSMLKTFAQDEAGELSGWIQYGGCNIVSNRNKIVSDFLDKSEAEHLLFIDTDESFPPDAPKRLQEAVRDVSSIVGGAYPLKDSSNVFYERTGPGEYRSVPPQDGVIQELDAVGSGFMMIPRKILETMKECSHLPSSWWFGQDYEGDHLLGSDVTFCRRARETGHRIYGHGGVRIGHLKPQLMELP